MCPYSRHCGARLKQLLQASVEHCLRPQLAGQLAAAPLHTYGVHDGLPVAPAGALVQVPTPPSPPVRLQASQAPAQALLQHTPSTQLPLEHSTAAEQGVPAGKVGR